MSLAPRFHQAVQQFWALRSGQYEKQAAAGRIDAGARGAVTGGGHMAPLEELVVSLLLETGLEPVDVRTRSHLDLPGYYRPTKQWDLLVVSADQLVAAIEFKSQVGSVGKNFSNRAEEAIGSATDIWTAYREGRLGRGPRPFLGYFFLLEDDENAHQPRSYSESLFPADPIFRGASYAQRYQVLCQRLVTERLYDATCVTLATNEEPTQISFPAGDVSFSRFVAEIQGHAYRFVQNRRLES